MNGYDCILVSLKGERPGRTPVMLHNFMMAAREAGFTMSAFRGNPILHIICYFVIQIYTANTCEGWIC